MELDLKDVSATQPFMTERMTTASSVVLTGDKRPTNVFLQSEAKLRRLQARWRGRQLRKQFEHLKRREQPSFPYFSAQEVRETLSAKPLEGRSSHKYTYRDGGIYAGQWLGGFRHGKGCMRWADGAQYEGEWAYGRPWGQGEFRWAEGERFVGEWRRLEGAEDGYGEFYSAWLALRQSKAAEVAEISLSDFRVRLEGMAAVLQRLRGAVARGLQPVGEGRVLGCKSYPNGVLYEGELLGEKRDGRGKAKWPNSDFYEGDWKADSQHGFGHNKWSPHAEYFGQYQANLKHGIGEYMWEDGSRYLGEWKEDRMAGVGRYEWPDGRAYLGQWSAGLLEGWGELRNGDKRFVGRWHAGRKQGLGITYHANGRVSTDRWAQGHPVCD